jgi:2-iminobutanoate/2-iminopropanoate deaminase
MVTVSPRNRRRTRLATAAAIATALLAALCLQAPAAGAAGTRTVSVTWSCTSTSLNAGSSTTCKITVSDSDSSGSKNDPDGTLAFSTASPSTLVDSVRLSAASCTLADDGKDKTACSITVRPLGNGSPVMTAAYTSSDDHQDKSANRTLTVSSNSNPVIAPTVSLSTTAGIISDTFEAEFRRSMENVRLVLETAGSDLSHVVQTRNYVRDAEDLPLYNKLYREYFPSPRPARTTIVNCLDPSLRYEVEAVAVKRPTAS